MSEATVREMVAGVVKALTVDYGIATSGIAGPDGGTADKPVGTVWIAVGDANKVVAKKYLFKGNREQNIRLTAMYALQMMRQFLRDHLA